MTEHEHMPPITKRGDATWLSPGKITVTINGTPYVMTTREARMIRNSIDVALDGPGPEIVCEVVEQRL